MTKTRSRKPQSFRVDVWDRSGRRTTHEVKAEGAALAALEVRRRLGDDPGMLIKARPCQ